MTAPIVDNHGEAWTVTPTPNGVVLARASNRYLLSQEAARALADSLSSALKIVDAAAALQRRSKAGD